jgi:hypothetical protein
MNRKQLIYIKWSLYLWFTAGRKHHVELQVLGRSCFWTPMQEPLLAVVEKSDECVQDNS